jgi:hypothetical protein
VVRDEAAFYNRKSYKPDFSSLLLTVASAVVGCSLGACFYVSFRVGIALITAFSLNNSLATFGLGGRNAETHHILLRSFAHFGHDC